jgi:excisionase family DNA binding protein
VFLVVIADTGGVSDNEWLSTGQVAALLGVSRQHVVDLCARGALPYATTGTHRRVRRADAQALLSVELPREAERSLWLHRAVAGRLVRDPEAVMATARRNLARMHEVHPSGMAAVWLDEWDRILAAGVDDVLDVLASRAERAVDLRQNSPFAGVLSPRERSTVAAAFAEHWRRDHAA